MNARRISALHVPDLPAWRADPHYSPVVAAALKEAYAYLHAYPDNLPAAIKTFVLASPHRRRRMASPQRMNLYYVLGQSAAGMGEPGSAFEMLDHALDQSAMLHDRGATAELLFLSGAIKRGYARTHDALSDLRASLSILNEMKDAGAQTDPLVELNVFIAMAICNFFLARYDMAQLWLADAHRLHNALPSAEREHDLLVWIEALAHRYTGHPEIALPLLTTIAIHVDTMPSPSSFGRIYTAIADATLDLAERAQESGAIQSVPSLLTRAHEYALKGEAMGVNHFDEPGAMIARLALARHGLLSKSDENSSDLIDCALKFAERTHDTPIIVQAMTTLAQELLARGESERARNILRHVLATTAVSERPFIGEIARRMLLGIDGFDNW
jgi:tetratricopeptide (TPR) repeat protein